MAATVKFRFPNHKKHGIKQRIKRSFNILLKMFLIKFSHLEYTPIIVLKYFLIVNV